MFAKIMPGTLKLRGETDLKTVEKTTFEFAERNMGKCKKHDTVKEELYEQYGVLRGLRDKNGKGVLVGITHVSDIRAKNIIDGKVYPIEGQLFYRGYNVYELERKFIEQNSFGFEECAYLLIFGELPTPKALTEFKRILGANMRLPRNFVRDVIMKAPSRDIMNSLTKSVLTLASYDKSANDTSMANVIRQCLQLVAEFPMLSVYGYHAYRHYICDDSLYIHRPDKNLSMAENILRMLRPNKKYTELEAKTLDRALILHMEHGGGNNSTFTTRVVTSAGSDTYSTIAAALSSLKGPKHGGANIKVMEMMEDIFKNVKDLFDRNEMKEYLRKILHKEAFDKSGLIYGVGHAVYSISDPRAVIFKGYVEELAKEKHMEKLFNVYSLVAELAPEVISEEKRIYKGVSVNVDFYSGLVYFMLGIPVELFTPIFAMGRIVGWSAHRIEELTNMEKIMRPAYESIIEERHLYE